MNDVQESFKIGQVAAQLGISTRTIRYYEEVGLMGDNRGDEGGVRFYTKQDILRLRFILKLKELGITLSEMKEMAINYDLNNQVTDKVLPQLVDVLESHLDKIRNKIDSLTVLSRDISNYRNRIIDMLQDSEAGPDRAANE